MTLPRRRRCSRSRSSGGAGRAAPFRELGTDPATNLPVVVKDGRSVPYVTDGTTNASLRKGDAVESIDIERAVRAAGRAPRRRALDAQEEGGQEGRTGQEEGGSEEGPGEKDGGKKPARRRAAKKAAGAKKAAPTEPF